MKLALFGSPVAHSLSPRLHNLAAQTLGVEAFYGRVEFDKNATADELLEKFFALKLSGANVTIPFKQHLLTRCSVLEERAKRIGALNTIVLKEGQLFGFNTDVSGFLKSIEEFGEVKKALILGAGGTAKAVSVGLSESGVECAVLNRSDKSSEFENLAFFVPNSNLTNLQKANLTSDEGSKRVSNIAKTKFDFSKIELVINTTPSGLLNASLPFEDEVMSEIFANAKFAFDAVYGRVTPFLQTAAAKGVKSKDGLEMLLFQAVFAFMHFCDYRFSFDEIYKAMRPAALL